MYLNNKEKAVINLFMDNCFDYQLCIMTLYWTDVDFITARYEEVIEDENNYDLDDPNYEEFYSFVFKVTKIDGNPPVEVYNGEYLLINYHNFPRDITVDGVKIN